MAEKYPGSRAACLVSSPARSDHLCDPSCLIEGTLDVKHCFPFRSHLQKRISIPLLPMATIEELLAKLDLSKFAAKFKEEDLDLNAAKKLSDEDLKELGLTMGAL
jgi:hypothetical protein